MKKCYKLVALTLLVCLVFSGCKSDDYKEAVALQDSGDYNAALAIYGSISDYKDSADRIIYCNEMIAAIDNFDSASLSLSEKNQRLDETISDAQELVYSGEKALDESLYPALETAISRASAARIDVEEIPATAVEIDALSQQYRDASYDSVIADVLTAVENLERSITQYALVDNPGNDYIVECLSQVPGITGIAVATEENDPNDHLGKPGWYTAQVYFAYDKVDPSELYGVTVMDNGTEGGGSIEVYANEDDAQARNDYLATFDGTIYCSGSHTVIGTVVVRTSDHLTASQQKELEAVIIDLLLGKE